MNWLTLGKNYLKRHKESIKKCLRKIRKQVNILFLKKKISGKNNTLSYKDTLLKKVS